MVQRADQWLSLGFQEEMSLRESQGRESLKETERDINHNFVLCLLDWLEQAYWFLTQAGLSHFLLLTTLPQITLCGIINNVTT